ncbi:MAG: AIR synthase related protein, partial [Pseudomonadota bacterium]
EKYDLDAEVIGMTTDTGRMVLKQFGETVCDIPVAPLAEDAPNYDRPWVEPPKRAPLDISQYPEPDDYGEVLLKLMSCPDMASKRWIWEQYDRHVMGDTVDSSQSMGNAAIVRIHGTSKALAITSDCTPRYVAADPYEGGKQVVAEAYRNLSAVGAKPIAITDNLNFGNPEKPETMGYIVKAIEGMAEACRELDFPVVSGNVSLYNETDGIAIPPTPVVGGVGLIEDLDKVATLKGAQAGDTIILVGATNGEIGSSLYAREVLGLDGVQAGAPPSVDLAINQSTADLVRSLIDRGLVNAVHDVSDGGVVCAVAEMALAQNTGIGIQSHKKAIEFWFAEHQGCFLLSVKPELKHQVRIAARDAGVDYEDVATVGTSDGHRVELTGDFGELVNIPLHRLREAHEGWLPAYMAAVE